MGKLPHVALRCGVNADRSDSMKLSSMSAFGMNLHVCIMNLIAVLPFNANGRAAGIAL